jgi:hypothetical protein
MKILAERGNKRPSWINLGLAILVLIGLIWFASPAGADGIFCVTAFYTLNGDGPHYLADNQCYGPGTHFTTISRDISPGDSTISVTVTVGAP